jgi:hypothetical protein
MRQSQDRDRKTASIALLVCALVLAPVTLLYGAGMIESWVPVVALSVGGLVAAGMGVYFYGSRRS